ncbi:methyltransferase domain-containing protein [Colletotrichum incanum]|nr:methyltransferase domain-containing protein [Colletotrichum incanum]
MPEPAVLNPTNNTPPSTESSPHSQANLDTGGDDDVIAPEESIASSTTSVSSSVMDYRDLQHNMFLRTFDNRLGTAPANEKHSNVGRVLDVGTGTGIWAIDFGDEHPDAEVLGVDISASWPNYMPPNVKFEIDDVEDLWTFSQPFDYIHSRLMQTGISSWANYLKKCYDNLTPGGCLEVHEIDLFPLSDDGTLKEDSAILKDLADVLINVGFEDVVVQRYKWPTNTWPKDAWYKELGSWCHDDIVAGWEGFCLAPFTRALNWSKEEVMLFMIEVRKEFADKQIHAYFSVWSIYGRKPNNPQSAAA